MAEIAVLHNTFDFRGGADAVCLHACAALAPDHDVTVLGIGDKVVQVALIVVLIVLYRRERS